MAFSDTDQLRFLELCKLHNVSATLDDGDTLVFIDYPSSPRSGPPNVDCYGRQYRSQSIRVRSEKLRATGSSRFLEMLAPEYQCRVRRQRKLQPAVAAAAGGHGGDHGLPDAVKYVLDLTPPSEGEDLVFQVATMSLSPGIIGWWRQASVSEIDPRLIKGHDDVCCCAEGTVTARSQQKNEDGAGDRSGPLRPGKLDEPLHNVPDYCPIRHRNSILRILMLIEGWDIVLDSASRVWSLVAAAKILDCASVIRDPVAQWIMDNHNMAFIEILPEEALQIGFDLELVQVTQFAFQVLVSELAIKLAATSLPDHTHDRDASKLTVFGRRTAPLDDELSNMVQHAARVLVERTQSRLDALQDLTKLTLDLGPEWNALKEMERTLVQEDTDEEDCMQALVRLRTLIDGIARTTVNALHSAPSWTGNNIVDSERRRYIPQGELTPLSDIFESFNTIQKLMCPFFCTDLEWTWAKGGLHWRSADYAQMVEEFSQHLERFALNHLQTLASSKALDDMARRVADRSASNPSRRIISLPALDYEIRHALAPILLHKGQDTEPLTISRLLFPTLSSEETSFLPMWAGGCDDGTGGVFGSALPPADMGPVGPGPGYHTGRGLTVSTASTTESLVEAFAGVGVWGYTAGRSLDVEDSAGETRMSESFVTDGSEYRDAIRQLDMATLGQEHEADWEMDLEGSDVGSASTVMADLECHSVEDVDAGSGAASEDGGMSDDRSMVLVELC